MKNILIVALATTSLCLTATLGMAAEFGGKPDAAKSKVMAVCQNCHGPQGDSVLPTFPRLNGQQADYIVAQIKSIRARKRTDTHSLYMGSVVHDLDDAMIAELAKYFAGQSPTQPQTGGALAAEGEKIFTGGATAEGVSSCQTCHGMHGEGTAMAPRIAGQHGNYLRMSLGAFRSTLRGNDAMHAVAKNLTDRQIEALASYLAND